MVKVQRVGGSRMVSVPIDLALELDIDFGVELQAVPITCNGHKVGVGYIAMPRLPSIPTFEIPKMPKFKIPSFDTD